MLPYHHLNSLRGLNMNVVDSPIFTVTYNGKDISKDVFNYLIKLSFNDTVEGEASEFTILMEDVDANWKNNWYPTKGAKLTASIGGLDCGTFIIDEVELSGPPDIIMIKALSSISDIPKLDIAQKEAATIVKKIRTKKSKGHENKTLLQIAQDVAQHNGLTLQGKVPNIVIGRVTQKKCTDLKFLRRVSYDYGVIFRVMGSKLVFMSMKEIEQRGSQLTLDKTSLTRYRLKDKTFNTYSKCKVVHHYQKLKVLVAASVDATNLDGISYHPITAGDTVVVHRKVENGEQAQAMANAILYRKNSETQTGNITIPGNVAAIAGNNITLTGLGSAGSGIYHMMKTDHTVDRSNAWVIDIEIKKISNVDKPKPIIETPPLNQLKLNNDLYIKAAGDVYKSDMTGHNPVFIPNK